MTLRLGGMEVLTEGGLRAANAQMLPGLTVAGVAETQFFPKLPIPAGQLTPGTRIRLAQFGLYTTVGLVPTITPRVRLGGISVLPAKVVGGLLASSNSPWYSVVEILIVDKLMVASGILIIDDNQIRIFGGPPVTTPDLSQALDLTSTAQWGSAGCSITCQGWIANITPPAP